MAKTCVHYDTIELRVQNVRREQSGPSKPGKHSQVKCVVQMPFSEQLLGQDSAAAGAMKSSKTETSSNPGMPRTRCLKEVPEWLTAALHAKPHQKPNFDAQQTVRQGAHSTERQCQSDMSRKVRAQSTHAARKWGRQSRPPQTDKVHTARITHRNGDARPKSEKKSAITNAK
jgi:hypothetical protein